MVENIDSLTHSEQENIIMERLKENGKLSTEDKVDKVLLLNFKTFGCFFGICHYIFIREAIKNKNIHVP